jgi:hypothetical protein
VHLTQPLPICPPNPSRMQKEKRSTDSQDRWRQRVLEELDAIMHIASRASVSNSQALQPDNVIVMMMNILLTM